MASASSVKRSGDSGTSRAFERSRTATRTDLAPLGTLLGARSRRRARRADGSPLIRRCRIPAVPTRTTSLTCRLPLSDRARSVHAPATPAEQGGPSQEPPRHQDLVLVPVGLARLLREPPFLHEAEADGSRAIAAVSAGSPTARPSPRRAPDGPTASRPPSAPARFPRPRRSATTARPRVDDVSGDRMLLALDVQIADDSRALGRGDEPLLAVGSRSAEAPADKKRTEPATCSVRT